MRKVFEFFLLKDVLGLLCSFCWKSKFLFECVQGRDLLRYSIFVYLKIKLG